MTTTEQNGTAMAVRTLTDTQIQQRMKLNAAARFGLQDATPAQLNVIFLLAQRWGLDPVMELTLYEGRPFITLDGRLQLARRNPDYRGYRTRALPKSEREDWGYEPEDIVVECTVLTHEHGEITERGCVRRAEIESARKRSMDSGKRSAPVGIYGPEIAEARAIKRATRAAFGQDIPDEDDALQVIQEQRNDPVRQAALAAKYDEIYPPDEVAIDVPAEVARPELTARERAMADPNELSRQVQNEADRYNALADEKPPRGRRTQPAAEPTDAELDAQAERESKVLL